MTDERDRDGEIAQAWVGVAATDEPYRRALNRHRIFGEPAPSIGRFVLAERIGAGAMGIVYRARDPRLARPVALKLLRGRLSPLAAHRMIREARALAQVAHPNVVTIYEVGEVDGQPFIAMEYVVGETLCAWQRGRDAAACLRAYCQAAAGLSALHGAGLVHRDFKPTNVLMGRDGRVRVADLGLVRGLEEADKAAPGPDQQPVNPASLTAAGRLLGTPAYMAPEQLLGYPATPLSDQYALCVAVVEALTGERPGPTGLDRRRRHPRLTPQLRDALSRGLQTDPAQRWPDVAALSAAWSAPSRDRRWPIGAGLLLAGVVGLGVLVTERAPTDPQTSDPPTSSAVGSAAGRAQQAALARAERLFKRDPTSAATVLKALDSSKAGWTSLARRVIGTPTAWATVQLDDDVHRVALVPGHGVVARFDDGTVAAIGADGARRPISVRIEPQPAVSKPETSLTKGTTRAESARWQAVGTPGGDVELRVDGQAVKIGAVDGPIVQLAAEPTGRWIAARTRAAVTIWPWPADTRKPRTFAITGRLWFIDADTVAHASRDGVVEVVELMTGQTYALKGHARSVLHVAGDATRVVTVTQARVLRVWARAAFAGALLGRHAGKIWAAAQSDDGRLLATAGHDGAVGVVDLRGAGTLRHLPGPASPRAFQVAFSPDGARLAATGNDRLAHVWSMDKREQPPMALTGHAGWAYGLNWSPDGRWIATGDREGGVRIWSAGTGGPGRLLGRHPGTGSMRRVHTLVFTRASDAIVSAAKNGSLIRWPLEGGAPKILARTGNGTDVRRLRGGQILATSYGGESRVLTDAGELVATYTTGVSAMGWAVAADGARFATAHADGSIHVWAVDQPHAPIWSRPPGEVPAEALAFDGSATRLAIGDTQGGLTLHAIDEPQAPLRLHGHGAAVRFLAFDGATLISAAFDGAVRRWDAPADTGLSASLARRTTDCVLASQRVAWLGETSAEAAAQNARCRRESQTHRAAAVGP